MNRRNFLKAAGANVGALAISGPDALGATGRAQRPALRPAVANRLTADVAVIGAGVFGGWTALSIREMGLSVVLIDQYGPGNSKSSSGGEVRGMRAHYGDREYANTPWAIAAMEQWKIREGEFGTKLYFESGVLGVSRGLTSQATASRAVFDKLKIPYEISHARRADEALAAGGDGGLAGRRRLLLSAGWHAQGARVVRGRRDIVPEEGRPVRAGEGVARPQFEG